MKELLREELVLIFRPCQHFVARICHKNHILFSDATDAGLEDPGFYRNYHSSRYVGDLLVMRLREAPTEPQLARLNDEFRDILADGTMTVGPALPEETNDHAIRHLPRLVLHFNRKDIGRLRQLIDALNRLSAVPSGD